MPPLPQVSLNSNLVTGSQGEQQGLPVGAKVGHACPQPQWFRKARPADPELPGPVGHPGAAAPTHPMEGLSQKHFRPQAGIATFLVLRMAGRVRHRERQSP